MTRILRSLAVRLRQAAGSLPAPAAPFNPEKAGKQPAMLLSDQANEASQALSEHAPAQSLRKQIILPYPR